MKGNDVLGSLEFLPISREDMDLRGWQQADFILVSGDAYVDHPSFGAAVIGRVLESRGFKVCILPQPDIKNDEAFTAMGKPRLGFLITSGNIDSMVNHYTAAKKPRRGDAYSPGGKSGFRPDRATTVYSQILRRLYPDSPVILGGLEASLRRFAHYDYWDDKIRPSVLVESGADLIIYGMGERSVCLLAQALAAGTPLRELTDIPGTVYPGDEPPENAVILPAYEELLKSKRSYARSFMTQYRNMDALTAKPLAEPCGGGYVIQNPPAAPLSREELDQIYDLPYRRAWHPIYDAAGGVPAIQEVRFSITSNRGCFGGCNFCALTFHQGRSVRSRSHESILREARQMLQDPDFKGYIHDVGGPTANFRSAACKRQDARGVCTHRLCLFPNPCKELVADHSDYLSLLRELRSLPGVKKVFIRSGIRYDYLMLDAKPDFFRELCAHHVSGQLKVAPEHISPKVLHYMGKPGHAVYEKFVRRFKDLNREIGKEQYLVPYLMSSHPGSGLKEAVALAEYLRDTGHSPEQVQDFYPTPGTMSTCMFYTGLDPRTMEPVYVPKTPREKAMQRALIQYKNPKNYSLVLEALRQAGREDLIGIGGKALIRPPAGMKTAPQAQKKPAAKAKSSGGRGRKSLAGTRWDGDAGRKGRPR